MKPSNTSLSDLRTRIREHYLAKEGEAILRLASLANLSLEERERISTRATALVRKVRGESKPTLMEQFLAEYGLSTKEGVALMCLAEALLRIPDAVTIDALIEDKLVSGNWREHCRQSPSPLINYANRGLLITGQLLMPPLSSQGLTQNLRALVKRLGKPVVRTAVGQAMKLLGREFVLGRNIKEALKRARGYEAQGYKYSYDMLGEAAWTRADAERYFASYSNAIAELAKQCRGDIYDNPGISIKLSALHPRYDSTQKQRVIDELVPRIVELAKRAKDANMGLNIDAEEAERLDISLDVIEAVLSSSALNGWNGFGVVVQAFGPRAVFVLDWLYALTEKLDRKIMVRLVKGAYWDSEIKRAQELGLDGFPVFTRKAHSDVSYIACAKKLLAMSDRIYPQFATHNAHTVSAILELNDEKVHIEFQRLHGMGESLYNAISLSEQVRCRIYAPVGEHVDLLAYLVRRLLENGANSSFVNQMTNHRISPEKIAADPFLAIDRTPELLSNSAIRLPSHIFMPERANARGWDIHHEFDIKNIRAGMQSFQDYVWQASPMIAGEYSPSAKPGAKPDAKKEAVYNPAVSGEKVGWQVKADKQDVFTALAAAEIGVQAWRKVGAGERRQLLLKIAETYEKNAHEFFALATREAGKNLADGIAELREAVDFARYYASKIADLETNTEPRGIITCISPWNFPLAIFSGQIFAALAAGNVVVAKPAEQTPLIAAKAVELMYLSGIPKNVVQLLPGDGANIGALLCSDSRVSGVCFTGSTATAKRIDLTMAEALAPDATLVAETGGLNAMIVDSSALPEQVIKDILASAFQSAGQRCSALRMLYIQKEVYARILEMLFGAMDELKIGNPLELSTDIGPVIDSAAQQKILNHCEKFQKNKRVLKTLIAPQDGNFVAPTVIELNSITELEEEIFGPVLHVAPFDINNLDSVIEEINQQGYGLTFGVHTRIDDRVNYIIQRINAGNMYVNRNQIGAIVGSQPFGGEGLSGTGPKAGGPNYVKHFTRSVLLPETSADAELENSEISRGVIENEVKRLQLNHSIPSPDFTGLLEVAFELKAPRVSIGRQLMPGPTGESNELCYFPRGVILCLGPSVEELKKQALTALSQGNAVIIITSKSQYEKFGHLPSELPTSILVGKISLDYLTNGKGFAAVACSNSHPNLRSYRIALSKRSGALLPLITDTNDTYRFILERHICIDTAAAGGNASLLSQNESDY